jgi:phosphoribosyl 1,2-cyclic phosphodiesterase
MISNLDLFRNSVSFANLGSGSRGNATLVASQTDAVLIDCGLSCRQVEGRLKKLGVASSRISAILITHEHADHVAGARVTARTLGVPVYMTRACRERIRGGRMDLSDDIEVRLIKPGHRFRVGSLEVDPFRVPHDSVDPVGFVVGIGGDRVGVATDMGSPTRKIIEILRTCRVVLLEFNHDERMLLGADLPWSVIQRVRSGVGHLSNRQARDIVKALRRSEVEEIWMGHLSESNNTPGRALEAARAGVGDRARKRITLSLAKQDDPSTLVHLGHRAIRRRSHR